MQCTVCGGVDFTSRQILWDKLIQDWQLSPAEVDYINRQQAQLCTQCGGNLRSIALANALRAFLGTSQCLREAVSSPKAANLSILEINEAGTLSPVLRKCGGYVFGAYPEVDIHRLPYASETFDVVVHSDTLEHVEQPIHALRECRRVLKPDGALCFTVPVIVGRLSRNRQGLPKSFHGNPATAAADFAVQTEFGADVWTYIFEAGFQEVSIHSFGYPAGLAFLAREGVREQEPPKPARTE